MAFDRQETNTIVTLHSSGGQGLLQMWRWRGLFMQAGGQTDCLGAGGREKSSWMCGVSKEKGKTDRKKKSIV